MENIKGQKFKNGKTGKLENRKTGKQSQNSDKRPIKIYRENILFGNLYYIIQIKWGIQN
jgi:hypothetical protein